MAAVAARTASVTAATAVGCGHSRGQWQTIAWRVAVYFSALYNCTSSNCSALYSLLWIAIHRNDLVWVLLEYQVFCAHIRGAVYIWTVNSVVCMHRYTVSIVKYTLHNAQCWVVWKPCCVQELRKQLWSQLLKLHSQNYSRTKTGNSVAFLNLQKVLKYTARLDYWR